MKYTVLFFTHSGAIKFERKMKSKAIEVVLKPVPRQLSSNCGICAELVYEALPQELIDDEVEKIFDESLKVVYDAE